MLHNALSSTATFNVVLKPKLIAERGWGELGVLAGSPITYASSTDGKDISIPTHQYEQDLALSGGALLNPNLNPNPLKYIFSPLIQKDLQLCLVSTTCEIVPIV